MDADIIYVMGGGEVLEHGTHKDLFQNGGAYTRLVEAQKLREVQHANQNFGAVPQSDDIKAPRTREVASLDKTYSINSQADNVIDVQSTAITDVKDRKYEGNYSIFYIVRRILPLARSQWRNYLLGTLFAISEYHPSLIRCC